MAVEVKLQTVSARDDTSDDASSVTAVSYEDHTPAVKGHPGALTAVPASPSTSYRTPDDILRLTTEDNFFQPCPSCSLYRSGREVQLTFYNLDSHRPCCSVCKHLQGTKAVVQVRRSSYHDVVRVSEIVHMFDISSIQPYWINNDRVVFLRPRPQPRPPRGCSFPAVCRMCNRQLMDSHSCYCSLQCKLQGAYGLDSVHGRTPMAMLPHWGNARKRTAPAAESSHMDDKDFHHLQSPRSCSEDEDGLSSAKWMASRFAFNTLPLTAGSKKRKLTPTRSPLQ